VQNTARGKWRDWSDGFWRKSESSNRCLNMVPNYLCFSRIRIIGYSLNNQHIWTEIQCHVSFARINSNKSILCTDPWTWNENCSSEDPEQWAEESVRWYVSSYIQVKIIVKNQYSCLLVNFVKSDVCGWIIICDVYIEQKFLDSLIIWPS
jgi:hypothetical protein